MHDAKPFEATPSRIARAKREGDVPRSAELSAALALGGGTLAICLVFGLAMAAAAAALRDAARGLLEAQPYEVVAGCAFLPALAAPMLAALTTIAVAGGVSVRAPRLDLAKLNPSHGFRRIVSLRTASFAARALLTACVAALALFPAVRDAALLAPTNDVAVDLAATAIGAGKRVLLTATAVGLAFGMVDMLLERRAWRARLRMSLDEMKRDLKQTEGDPALRSRRRTQHRSLLRGSLSRLSEASFVVANPTHVAVALEYRPPDVAVPRVIVRAVDDGARLLKLQARVLRIPIIEDVVLARTLLATTRIDEVIPRACYMAVARIVAMLSQAAQAG